MGSNAPPAVVPAVQAEENLESFERLHLGFKELDPIPQFRATAKARRVPGESLLGQSF